MIDHHGGFAQENEFYCECPPNYKGGLCQMEKSLHLMKTLTAKLLTLYTVLFAQIAKNSTSDRQAIQYAKESEFIDSK